MNSRSLLFGIFVSYAVISLADQPIMNMMPRWDDGYGFQIRQESIIRRDLLLGNQVIGSGFSEELKITHLEAVYTFDRSVRITAKFPYIIQANREILGKDNEKVLEKFNGWGDLTLALPLKKYFNLDGRSGSWTFTPQIRVPIESSIDSYQVPDRLWGSGLHLGYETETVHWFFSLGSGIWAFERDKPVEYHASIDLGWNFRNDAQILIESDIFWDEEGTELLSLGPALYLRWNHNIHSRFSFQEELLSKTSKFNSDHGNTKRLTIGFGCVF